MLKMDDDLNTINNTLTRCERSIKNMGSLRGAFSNWLSKPAKPVDNTFKGGKDGGATKVEEPKNTLLRPSSVHDKEDISRLNILELLEKSGTKTFLSACVPALPLNLQCFCRSLRAPKVKCRSCGDPSLSFLQLFQTCEIRRYRGLHSAVSRGNDIDYTWFMRQRLAVCIWGFFVTEAFGG